MAQGSGNTRQNVSNAMNRLSHFDNLYFQTADSMVLVPQLIEKYEDRKIGLFVDGPKQWEGVQLCKSMLESSNVYFSSLHDWVDMGWVDIPMDDDLTEFSSRNKEFRSQIMYIDKEHPQIVSWPDGPGMHSWIK